MKDYIPKSKKPENIKKLINESLDILESIGIPLHLRKERGLEKMGMCFLALLDVKNSWQDAKSVSDGYGLSSKEIIKYLNANFQEEISLGSYDDIPRDNIELLLSADVVERSGIDPKSNYNSPKRKYTIPTFIQELVLNYNTNHWEQKLATFLENRPKLVEEIKRLRYIELVPVQISENKLINLSPGGHNDLQKVVIEQFIPRFTGNSKVLYLGDGANKSVVKDSDALKALNFFEISHGLLPDIVAYNAERNLLFLIEAFFTTGTISEIRMRELKKNLEFCKAELIFVTAFLTREEFQKQMGSYNIAWESEVWTADHPDHMVHFNGTKFLGSRGFSD